MGVNVKQQRDYLLTEVGIELPCQLNDLDALMRAIRGTGKIVATYSQGGLLGVNIEQRATISERQLDKVRAFIGVESREVTGG